MAVINRSSKLSNCYEFQNYKVIYKRYASLYFICLCDLDDNELIILEFIHHFVECLDKYFGNVCELDIIFNFHKAYFIFEELIMSGYIQESSKSYLYNYNILKDKKAIKKSLDIIDSMLEEEKEDEYTINSTITNKNTGKKK